MDFDIVQLTSSNSELLSNIREGVFDEEIKPGSLSSFLNDRRHVMFLAIDASRTVVGMASGVEYFHPDKPAQFWINEVGVAGIHRRNGIGRSLVQALIAEAKNRGCVYTWLGTEESNVAGKACFGSVPEVEDPQSFLLYGWGLDK